MVLERLRDVPGDRYRIERELGRCGMVTVYLAEDLRHRRLIAHKVIHAESAPRWRPEDGDCP